MTDRELLADELYPARPYPGARPACSFVHEERIGRVVAFVDGRWWVRTGLPLDEWLAGRGAAPISGRSAVLAYGSNACPSKITWLRENHGLTGPVVVLRAECVGLAAVWAAGLRVVDDQRPATLAAVPGAREWHAIWLATDDQTAALDRCEGRGERYDLARIRTGRILLENGEPVRDPLAYVGRSARRMPLLVDGAVQRCADVPQDRARDLIGAAASTDGLVRDVLPPPSP